MNGTVEGGEIAGIEKPTIAHTDQATGDDER